MTAFQNDPLRQARAEALAHFASYRPVTIDKWALVDLRERGLSTAQVDQAIRDLVAVGRMKVVEEYGSVVLHVVTTEDGDK